MKYSDFEKHIGNELGEAQEAVNMNELLIGLNLDNLASERKGRPFPLWIMIPLLLIGSLATFVAMDGNNVFNLNQVSENTVIQAKSENNVGITNINLAANTQLLNNKATDTGVKILQSITTGPTSKNSDVKLSNNKTALRESDLANLEISQEAYAHSRSIQRKKTPTGTIPIVKEDIFPNPSLQGLSNFNTSNSAEESKDDVNEIERSYYKSTSNKDVTPMPRANLSLASISKRSISISNLDSGIDNMFSRMKINCPSFNQAQWNLALIPEVGIFAPFKTIANKRQEDIQAFEERQTYEETLEGINIGLYTMLVRDKLPIYLKAGISYSRISERMDLVYNYKDTIIERHITSKTVSANGDTINEIWGDVEVEITKTGKNRQHNYIHLFDLPVSVGYNAYLGGFDLGIEVGVKINLMTRATGNLLTSKSDFTNLSLNEYYKKRIGLSYFGGIMIGRNFGRFGDFYIAPRFTYYPTDFSNDNNAISQKYVTMGVNVGYVYKLK